MKALAGVIFTILFCVHVQAQVNAYARVTAISSTTLTIGVSNETYGTFTTGSQIIVMQMQDNVIGSNTSNNASFGTLSSIQTTGQYEVAYITSVTRVSGSVTQVTIGGALANTYNTGANSIVQIISYPLLSATNYTTTSDITAVAWNGFIGGVVAFKVTGTLTLNHNITADNAGFRGGTLNSGTAGSCDNSTYITSANDLNANKGEGIYRAANSTYAAGRGRILNGGGGANSHNGGGGGGSNATAGGEGGKGYGCTLNAGGLGGATLYSYISSNRVFMGGGAGAGEANNSFNTAGGNGGGIVIVTANQIVTTGSGSSLRISANGQTAADVGNDGAGGGGAGGTVMLNVNSWNIAATKTLTISSNGGNGGNVTDAASHGGGGGGGQGAVIFSTATPTSNITTRTLNGSGGRNYAGGTFADNAAGSDNAAIFNSSFALLPLQVLSFKGNREEDISMLSWQVVHEADVMYYEVQRSHNGGDFSSIAKINRQSEAYSYRDESNEPENFYRIAIYLKSGHVTYTNVIMLKARSATAFNLELIPNPVVSRGVLKVESKSMSPATVKIVNSIGMVVSTQGIQLRMGTNDIPVTATHLANGVYHVVLNFGSNSSTVKMLVRK